MKRKNQFALTWIFAAGFLAGAPMASAQTIDCKTLKDAVSAAPGGFISFRGERKNLPLDPQLAKAHALMNIKHQREAYAATRKLSANTNCSVIAIRSEDAESITTSTHFECDWPGAPMSKQQFQGLKKALRACVTSPQSEENDPDFYALYLNQVESGKGLEVLMVTTDRQVTLMEGGTSAAVAHLVCKPKVSGGCDDE
jgi:hypothetical protein